MIVSVVHGSPNCFTHTHTHKKKKADFCFRFHVALLGGSDESESFRYNAYR